VASHVRTRLPYRSAARGLALWSLPLLVSTAVLALAPAASARSALTLTAPAPLVTAPAPFAHAAAAEAAPPVPPNDEVANAQAIASLPATVNGTVVGATSAASEPSSSCGSTAGSVWYTLHTGASAQRIGVELAAAGKLDATVDVYRAVRSSLSEVRCQQTEEEGKAALTFRAAKNAVYEIRVAALTDSQLAGFALSVFLPTPAVAPPGAPLPAGGVSGHVDRIQNINAAYAVTLHAGVSYMIGLANETKHGACPRARLFAPGTGSFEGAQALAGIECSGYQLFTPGPGMGGRYSIEITPRAEHTGVQRFHLQVARAGADETAPGIALGNYGVAHAHLDGAGVQVLRLYRLDVASHSNLTLRLHAPSTAKFNLRLLGQDGNLIACQCGGSGSQKLQQKLTRGRYYVAVSVRNGSSGNFALERESRTITRTTVFFAGGSSHAGRAGAHLGRPTPIRVHVTTGASGPVTLNVERFDPVFGWQFFRQARAYVSGGTASIPFTAPAVGQWRVNAAYAGSRVSSPSRIGFSYLLVS
jgi:hypothetical protein